MRHSWIATAPASLLAFALACGGGSTSSSPREVKTGPAAVASHESTPAPPSPSGDRSDSLTPPAAVGPVVTAGALRFELPAPFEREAPASPMRLAQAVVSGEAGPAELAVFYFGAGQGGSVDANFERWLAQIERPKRAPEPQRGTFTADSFDVFWIEATGTLLPSGMGTGPKTPQPDSRLLGAVVQGTGGPWFFKLTGPDATVAAAREPFLAMLRGLRRAG